jgi:hypothetical protein
MGKKPSDELGVLTKSAPDGKSSKLIPTSPTASIAISPSLHYNFIHFAANDTNLYQDVYVNEVSFCFALLMTCITQKSLLFDD